MHRQAVLIATLCSVAGALGIVPAPLRAQVHEAVSSEERTAAHFEAIRNDPVRTLMFLRRMPKGGDLHSHLSGAIYAESYIRWAADAGLCIDTREWSIAAPPCDAEAGRSPAATALQDPSLRDSLIDAMSVRNWHAARGTGHAQFFGSFDRFRMISNRTGDMLAEVAARAASGSVSYLELMVTPPAAGAGRGLSWDEDFERMRATLLGAGLRDSVARARAALDAAEVRQREVLGCSAEPRAAGCDVVIRYLYQGLRARPPEAVFAHLLTGFELAAADPRVVGLNLVQPEDHPIALRDYSLHMRMVGALRAHYPDVGITLHAGELTAGLVPPEDLRFHIREAVEVAHATRIGHGVSIAHEDDAENLLAELARRRVLIEIALGSNDRILGVVGAHHPLSLYMASGVPVALVTDDEGVLRTDMTMQYIKAVEDHGLGYIPLKTMARNSLEHAFIEGASLWRDGTPGVPVPSCAPAAGGLDGGACRDHLAANPKARLQAQLERDFASFERAH
jgi:adenosine deaminase